MTITRRSRPGALALTAVVALAGIVGCGGGGDRYEGGAPATPQADALEVTYYYLPG